ncbi:MAG: hypothetical protein OXC60_04525 [Litoreibacter sp.]|nr:hypothetical protein [Litoreibacter sp.]
MDALRSVIAQNALITSRLAALENLVVGGRFDIGTVADPPPDGGGIGGIIGGGGGIIGGGIGPIADPLPIDLGKLSKVQLETRLADIEFNRKKLDTLEEMFKGALAEL